MRHDAVKQDDVVVVQQEVLQDAVEGGGGAGCACGRRDVVDVLDVVEGVRTAWSLATPCR